MTHINDSKEVNSVERHISNEEFQSGSNLSFDNRNSSNLPPIKFEINMHNSKGQFNQFLNFVEKVMKDKDSKDLSSEALNELKSWFPFLNNNMTVYLNIDLYVNNEEKKAHDIVQKPLSIPNIKFPTPLPRSSAGIKEISQNSINELGEEKINDKTGITPKKLFIPCIKKAMNVETQKPLKSEENTSHINGQQDVELDNLYLSNLLKKRNVEDNDIIRTMPNRPFKSDDLMEIDCGKHSNELSYLAVVLFEVNALLLALVD